MTLFDLIPRDLILESKGVETLSPSSLTDHSGQVAAGGVYFAIRGTSFDGHLKITEVSAKGVSAIVVEDAQAFQKISTGMLVRSTRKAFAIAASRFLGEPTRSFDLIGITGTNGKTTTSYLLYQVWQSLGLPAGLIGTVETRIGDERTESGLTTPGPWELQNLFLKMKQKQIGHAVMEVSSIALDQFRTAGTVFKGALFTNLTQDHLDYHGTFERYCDAKRRLFEEYPMEFAVMNADDAKSAYLVENFQGKKISYSVLKKADFYPKRYLFDRSRTVATIASPVGELELTIPLIGDHNLSNALGVLAICHALKFDLNRVIAALAKAPGAPGRLEKVPLPVAGPSVFVDYAHSPDALENVLGALRKLRKNEPGRILTVFGCGGDRDRTKRPLMAEVVCRLSDVVVITSDNPRTENPETILDDVQKGIPAGRKDTHREVNRKKAIHLAMEIAKPEDLVLIAGKGHENYQIIGKEKLHFDDREAVLDYYA